MKAVARGGIGGSADPTWKPVTLSFGRKADLILLMAVINVSIFNSGGNRPPWAIKGDSLTPHKITQFREKKEKGRVHLRAIV